MNQATEAKTSCIVTETAGKSTVIEVFSRLVDANISQDQPIETITAFVDLRRRIA